MDNANESERSKNLCVYDNCLNHGKFQCSRCKKSYYCCQDHQKYHWKIHKIHCKKNMTTIAPSNGNIESSSYYNSNSSSNDASVRDDSIVLDEKRNDNNNQKNIKDYRYSINDDDDADNDKRICRCMFCGEEMLLGSEDEAIKHMNICIALQEQLSSSNQFTIPTTIQNKMTSSSTLTSTATVKDPSVSTPSLSNPINITDDKRKDDV